MSVQVLSQRYFFIKFFIKGFSNLLANFTLKMLTHTGRMNLLFFLCLFPSHFRNFQICLTIINHMPHDNFSWSFSFSSFFFIHIFFVVVVVVVGVAVVAYAWIVITRHCLVVVWLLYAKAAPYCAISLLF